MKIFITDGSVISFFTAVFDAWRERECVITSYENVQMSFGCMVIRVDGDENKSARVVAGIKKYDKNAPSDVICALRSCSKQRENIAFAYIKRLVETKSPIDKAYNFAEVNDFNEMKGKVTYEVHKLSGFLRFMECKGGALYAPYSPDNDITDMLMEHFVKRLAAEKFIIHDVKRKIAGVYDGKRCAMVNADCAQIYLAEREKAFQSLWQKYYEAVNIKERPHEKQMKGYMPVRYWKFLPEKQKPFRL